MLALVTGGHGFIGSHLCERLTAAGHRVRVLARPSSDLTHVAGLAVDVVRGDLTGDGPLGPAVAGVDWVFHLAGALKGFREADLLRVNRDGTERLTAACLAHAPGLSRFVLVSSLAAAGPSPGGHVPILEDDPARPLTWYGRSKLAAEAVVRDSRLPAVIVRPPIVFGPRDRDVFSYFRIAKAGILPVPGRMDRCYSLVSAADLADGILRAAEIAAPAGEIFHVTGPEVVTWSELGQKIAAALGVRGRVVRLPEFAVRSAGRVADLAARLRGRPEIFSSQKVIEMLAPAWVASPEKARRLLGWSAGTPLDDALALTVRWYATMAGSDVRRRPFGMTAPLGSWRALDRLVVGYALLSSAVLGAGVASGVAGCAEQLAVNAAVLVVALLVTRWSRDTTRVVPVLLRLCYVPAIYWFFYQQIETIWPIFWAGPLDAGLVRLEAWLFHGQPSLTFRAAFPFRWLSEIFCFSYFAYYFFTPAVFFTVLFRRGYLAAERIVLATSLCFLGCYTLFWMLPTVAPHFWFPPHQGPQLYDGYVFNHMLFFLAAGGEIRGAAFPSSHVAVALLLTLSARRDAPVLFVPLAVITALMLPAVVYLGAHYVVDVPAGLLTGLVAFAVTNRMHAKRMRGDSSGAGPASPAAATLACRHCGGAAI